MLGKEQWLIYMTKQRKPDSDIVWTNWRLGNIGMSRHRPDADGPTENMTTAQ